VILSDLSEAEVKRRLRAGEMVFTCGPFTVRVASPVQHIGEALHLLYADYPLSDGFADFRLDLMTSGGVRRWLRPKVVFTADGEQPFAPFPLDQAYPLFEWSLNWCIATVTHQCLIIHAAVVERDGRALILPGSPGTGKSTLAAALVNRGWRLFSDELTLIDVDTGRIVPLPRPISLKNASIDTIRAFAPNAVFGRITHNTVKGTICHMKPATDHVRRAYETALTGWVVFPKYAAGASAKLAPRSKHDTVLELARNCFNYRVLGRIGFDLLCDALETSECFDFEYGKLDDAVAAFDRVRLKEAA